jgi:7-keto-8-aminopelargonate synthetase-like enzyme
MGLRGDGTLVRVSWDHWARAERAEIAAADRWRTIRELGSGDPVARLDGCEVVSFASNDYFGLSQHLAVRAAAHEAIERWGTGAGSARLIAGSRPVHSELERELADWKGAERALLFPTGFAANLGVLSVVGGPDVTIISDQLNHASIIDGAHAALGPEPPRTGASVLRVGTLSKMLGSVGGFVAGRGPLVDLIINRARSFIFTTAPAPATTAAALAALRVLRSGAGDALRARLAALTSRVRPGRPSPIIPVVLGDEQISRLLTELAAVVPA